MGLLGGTLLRTELLKNNLSVTCPDYLGLACFRGDNKYVLFFIHIQNSHMYSSMGKGTAGTWYKKSSKIKRRLSSNVKDKREEVDTCMLTSLK